MRTLITPLLTFLLFSCAPVPVHEETKLATDTRPQEKIVHDDCPGYIPGNYYTYCIERSYAVYRNNHVLENNEEAEEDEEAEE